MQIDLNGTSAPEKGDRIPNNECAIVSTGNMTELKMLVPEYANGSDMPGVVAFLLAVFMRSRDPEFVHEQLVWIQQLEAEIETQLFGARS
jgi:hypothetical protein